MGPVAAEHWCSMNEIAAHLGVTRDTVLTWINNRGMPGVKIGRTWEFKISEVDAWVRAQDSRAEAGTEVNNGQ